MSDLSAIAARYSVPDDAVRHLLDALSHSGGHMAQFNHPALGGMGQWHAGGMTMIGDMFNNSLKARVADLCAELAPLAVTLRADGASSGSGGNWWPGGLGQPGSAGSQNGIRYAVFPDQRRVAIERDGAVKLYDSGEHRIGGVSQQQGSGSDLSFTSQFGPVHLHSLGEIGSAAARPIKRAAESARVSDGPSSDRPEPHGEAPQARPLPAHDDRTYASPAPSSGGSADHTHVLGTLERLAELHKKGVLSDAEFSAKKTELLSRL